MKWNTEWVDLQNIEHMIAECWRMSERRLERYCKELSRQQNLIFAGELGTKFLEFICKSIDNDTPPDWSKLQRDVRLMKELIQDGQAQHDVYWRSQYQALTVNTSAYFQTEFGKVFTQQLAAKLELDVSQEQRMLLQDIQKIQKICVSCNWEDEEKAKKVLSRLAKDEKCYFSSWLGDIFLSGLQQRYGKTEEPQLPEEPDLKQEQKNGRRSVFKAKVAWTVLICITVGAAGLWLFMRSQGGQSHFRLPDIVSGILKNEVSGKEGALNGEGDINLQTESVRPEVSKLGDLHTDNVLSENRNSDKPETELPDIKRLHSQDAKAVSQENTADDRQQTADARGGKRKPDGAALSETNTTSGTKKPDQDTADTGMEKNKEPPDILPKYRSFYEQYPDLFAWLKIPETGIDHPVMQSDDGQRGEKYFYLHRDYTGKKSEEGSLFVESQSSCWPQDDNTVIYGHNMSNGRNFGILENYKDQNFFKKHQTIQYDTIYETGTYQIAAVVLTRILYQEEEGFRYYRFYKYKTEEEFQQCTDFIKENQLYDTQVELQYGDQLLMLSTCEYSVPNGRLVIIARKTS